MRKYYMSLRNNDRDGMSDAAEEIAEFNTEVPEGLIITPDTLERSIRSHTSRTEEAAQYGGMSYNKNFRATVDELMREYESGW